jgi:2-oxoacid:acceptor oxidoreductase gamma subunit (pyruvate/2-ketoisovalerate family)
MGAPVTAYTRISNEPIRLHCSVYDPDVVVVLDNTLLKTVPVTAGLNRDDDVLIINSPEAPSVFRANLRVEKGHVWTVPATEIALSILGAPITNTALLGVVARATEVVSMNGISIAIKEKFRTEIAEKNLAVIKQAFKEAKFE